MENGISNVENIVENIEEGNGMEEKMLHEQLQDMNLHGLSKCEILMELSGVDYCHDFKGFCGRLATPCNECRKAQKDALIQRIKEEYGVE